MTMAALLHGIRSVTTTGARLHWAPIDFLKAQNVAPWSDMPVWVHGLGESAGFGRISVAKAAAAGLTFRPLATTASDTLAWFKSQHAERQSTLRAGLDSGREKKLLASLAES